MYTDFSIFYFNLFTKNEKKFIIIYNKNIGATYVNKNTIIGVILTNALEKLGYKLNLNCNGEWYGKRKRAFWKNK